MTDKYITSSQYKEGLNSIKEYIDKSIPHIGYPVIFTLSADKVLEIYNSTNHEMEFDKPSSIDLNKEIIMTYNNEDIISENSPDNYIRYNNNNITVIFHIGFDINKNTNENKMVITIDRLNTNITSDLILKQREDKYLNNKYLKKDVAIQNSITIGTRIISSIGQYSFSNGIEVIASGDNSHAEGEHTRATNYNCHAEGSYSHASGSVSHAEGYWSTASGDYSHAEGNETMSSGSASHAEGNGTMSSGSASHAEGYNTIASSENQHVQGKYNIEDTGGIYAHIVGNGNDNNNRSNAHTLDWNGNAWYAGQVEGTNLPYNISSKILATIPANNVKLNNTITVNNASINKDRRYYIEFLGIKKLCSLSTGEIDGNVIICSINNYTIQAYNDSSNMTIYISNNSPTEELNSMNDEIDTYDLPVDEIIPNATDLIIHEEENKYLDSKYLETDLILQNSISLGRIGNIGYGSSAIGIGVEASGSSSHAEGDTTIASGDDSHAEGSNTIASGDKSHTEGNKTNASGTNSHAEGNNTIASGNDSHAEGSSTESSGYCSHSEGFMTIASNNQSHAEGNRTNASGNNSHAEGDNTTASGSASHAEGQYTIASSTNQHVQGKYNIEDTANKYAHIVGNGNKPNARSNAHTLDWAGNAWFAGNVSIDGTPTNDKDLVNKKYVDDKISNIPDAYTLLYPKEVDRTIAYYDIYDLPLGDYRIAQQDGIRTWNICVYVNNIRTQLFSTQNSRGFSFSKRINGTGTADGKSGKLITIDTYSMTTGGETYTRMVYDDGSVDVKNHKATILSAYTNTEFTPTKDYQPATKKYVDDAKASIVVPTKTSELTNDSNFLTEHQLLTKYATIEYVDSKLTTNYVSKEELTESTKPADTTTVKTTLNNILGGDYIE